MLRDLWNDLKEPFRDLGEVFFGSGEPTRRRSSPWWYIYVVAETERDANLLFAHIVTLRHLEGDRNDYMFRYVYSEDCLRGLEGRYRRNGSRVELVFDRSARKHPRFQLILDQAAIAGLICSMEGDHLKW